MINLLTDSLAQVGNFILTRSWQELFAVFWPFLLLDLPRYVLSDIMVLIRWLMGCEDNEAARRKLLSNPPLASAIVPAFNEEKTVLKTIQSLQEQTYPNLEIIVVDDGSGDRTYEVCLPLCRQGKITLLRNSVRLGKSAATNYALKFCKGEYVVVVDSDSSFDRDALLNLLAHFDNPDIGAVAGNIRVRNGQATLITELQAMEYQLSIAVGRRFTAWANILNIVSGAFGAFRKTLLDEAGGWDVGPGEDADITIKARKKLVRVAFAPDAVCMTNVPETVAGYIKQRLRWNRSLIRFRMRKHGDLFSPLPQNFSLFNLLGAFDTIYFQLVLGLSLLFYLAYLFTYFGELASAILLSVYLCYVGATAIQMLIALLLSERKREDICLLLYIPVFPLYKGYFLRMIRLAAYLDEFFFRRSYHDPYIPPRVGTKAVKW
jgi:cellulose synthase/poly-beta-1,6-N-acetylglucosamine synthase-like glycosyltransferase